MIVLREHRTSWDSAAARCPGGDDAHHPVQECSVRVDQKPQKPQRARRFTDHMKVPVITRGTLARAPPGMQQLTLLLSLLLLDVRPTLRARSELPLCLSHSLVP